MTASRWVEVAFGGVALVTIVLGDALGIEWSAWTMGLLGGAVGLVIPRPTEWLKSKPASEPPTA